MLINRRAFSFFCLYPLAGTWQRVPWMLEKRCFYTASVIIGQLYDLGGLDEQGNELRSAERFDPVAGTPQALALRIRTHSYRSPCFAAVGHRC